MIDIYNSLRKEEQESQNYGNFLYTPSYTAPMMVAEETMEYKTDSDKDKNGE